MRLLPAHLRDLRAVALLLCTACNFPPGEPPPPDLDRDGMADAWELSAGLSPNDPEDRNGDRDGDGWTNLEEYLHSLVP